MIDKYSIFLRYVCTIAHLPSMKLLCKSENSYMPFHINKLLSIPLQSDSYHIMENVIEHSADLD